MIQLIGRIRENFAALCVALAPQSLIDKLDYEYQYAKIQGANTIASAPASSSSSTVLPR